MTENDPIRSVNARLRNGQGRCYELAWRVMAYSDIAARSPSSIALLRTLLLAASATPGSRRTGAASGRFMIRCSITIFRARPDLLGVDTALLAPWSCLWPKALRPMAAERMKHGHQLGNLTMQTGESLMDQRDGDLGAEPCQGRGRGFESLRPLHFFSKKQRAFRSASDALALARALILQSNGRLTSGVS